MPQNWKTYKLGEVADVQNGYAFKSKDLVESGVPVIKIKNIVPPNVSLEGAGYFDGEIDSKLEKYIIKKGDFLISMTGSTVNVMSSAVGKMGRYRLDDVALLNQRAGKIYVTDPDQIDFEYLCQYLARYEVHYNLALNATGSANQANISPTQIKDIELNLPPLPEQTAIASILSTIDAKIENNLAINKTLEEMAMALYKEWFVDFGPFQDGKFVDSELGMIPEGWEVRSLRDVASINKNSIKKGRAPSQINYVDISSVGEGVVNNIEKLSFKEAPSRARRIINDGDIVWSSVRPNRKSRFLSLGFNNNTIVSTGFSVITPELVPFSYLYSYACTEDFVQYLVSRATGSSYPAVTGKIFEEALILLPTPKILKEYSKIVDSYYIRCSLNRKQNQTLTTLRDALLPKLISGEVRLNEFANT